MIMKNLIQSTIRKAIVKTLKAASFSLLPLAFCLSAHAQATTQVTPRVYTLVANQTLTSNQLLPAAASTNTFLAYSGSHSIGLWATVSSTNNVSTSNVTVKIDFAYDTAGGSSNALNGRYGTNFTTTQPFTWTFALNGTNQVTAATNILTSVWEPATAFRVTSISNGATGNINLTLQASVTP
jgi:hypothetical protein